MRYVAPVIVAVLAMLIGAILYLLRYEEVDSNSGPSPVVPGLFISKEHTASNKPSELKQPEAELSHPLTAARNDGSDASPLFASQKEEMHYYVSHVLALRIPEDSSLDDALGALYNGESKDDAWAVSLEESIHRATDGFKDIRIKKLDCRRSVCRLELEVSDPNDNIPIIKHRDFMKAFIQAKGNDALIYGRMNLFSTQWNGFILNLNQTASYIEQFRKNTAMIRDHQDAPRH